MCVILSEPQVLWAVGHQQCYNRAVQLLQVVRKQLTAFEHCIYADRNFQGSYH